MVNAYISSKNNIPEIILVLYNNKKEICCLCVNSVRINNYFLSVYTPNREIIKEYTNFIIPELYKYEGYKKTFRNNGLLEIHEAEDIVRIILDVYANEELITIKLADPFIFKVIDSYLEKYLFSF